MDCFHAGGFKPFSSSADYKVVLNAVNTIGSDQTVETMSAMRHNEVEALREMPGHARAV